MLSRRTLLGSLPVAAVAALAGCASEMVPGATGSTAPSGPTPSPLGSSVGSVVGSATGWRMPGEDDRHERTWMAWPSSEEVWGPDLAAVQADISAIALAIGRFEPVSMFARADQMSVVQAIGPNVTPVEGPVDDLWARDTLASLVVRRSGSGGKEMAAVRTRFNGWGDKQVHDGDTQLAGLMAKQLGVELIESGLVGEGGGIEIDGHGTLLASESCWVNDNRNPGLTRDEIQRRLVGSLGMDRMIWIDGLAGADITDGHIDTLGRFVNETTIVIDTPAVADPQDPWVAVARRTKAQLGEARTAAGRPYELVELVQPSSTRQSGEAFLSTYMNFYVCNGAVIAPEFGDQAADRVAYETLARLFPGRQVVQINIDGLAAGGGGIHCATQQQPAIR